MSQSQTNDWLKSCKQLAARIQAELPFSRPEVCNNAACVLLQPRLDLRGSTVGAFFRVRAGRCFAVRIDLERRAIVHLHDDGRLQVLGNWFEVNSHRKYVFAQDDLDRWWLWHVAQNQPELLDFFKWRLGLPNRFVVPPRTS